MSGKIDYETMTCHICGGAAESNETLKTKTDIWKQVEKIALENNADSYLLALLISDILEHVPVKTIEETLKSLEKRFRKQTELKQDV